jgi:hypothetical protein
MFVKGQNSLCWDLGCLVRAGMLEDFKLFQCLAGQPGPGPGPQVQLKRVLPGESGAVILLHFWYLQNSLA